MYEEYYRYDAKGFYRQCTTKQAAELLGVTRHEIARLIHAGVLSAFRSVGGAFLIDVLSLHDYARLNKGNGRPFSTPVAWGALWHLSGLEVDWLTYQQDRRLKKRLDEIDTDSLLWAVRNRAKMTRLSMQDFDMTKAKKSLVLTGGSAANLNRFSLTQNSSGLEGYINEDRIPSFFERAVVEETGQPNLILRIMGESTPARVASTENMPIAVVATDLASSLVSRERSAGQDTIDRVLDEWRRAA
jgi:excisionase family DNA binding protein